MRQLDSIVGILRIIMDRLGYQFPVRDIVAPQFIRNDLSWLSIVAAQQPPEDSLSRPAVSARLQIYVNDFAILVDRPSKIMLIAIDFDENLVDEERIAVTFMISLQSPGIFRAELYAPKANCFSAYGYSSFIQQIFNVPMTEIESKINPNGVADDSQLKSMAFVDIHLPSLQNTAG